MATPYRHHPPPVARIPLGLGRPGQRDRPARWRPQPRSTTSGNPYASLVLDVRRIANRSWDDATVFTVGVAFSSRRLDTIQLRD